MGGFDFGKIEFLKAYGVFIGSVQHGQKNDERA